MRTNSQATYTDRMEQSTAVVVGGASVTVAAANPSRVEITITNDHAANIRYLCLGDTATVNSGIRLNAAGGNYTTRAYSGVINAIATGAGTGVLVSEIGFS